MLVDNIRTKCAERGLSIFRLEKDCKIGNGTIGKWTDPKCEPSLKNVKKVADYFGVTVDELLREETAKNEV